MVKITRSFHDPLDRSRLLLIRICFRGFTGCIFNLSRQWGWVPFSGAVDTLSKATDAAIALSDEVSRVTQEADEAEAGAAVLRETASLEASRAQQLRTGTYTRQQ